MERSILLCCLFAVVAADPVVEGSLGKIAGRIDTLFDVEIEAFLGIPFAKAPIGKLRFALPEPFGVVGDLNATEYGPACAQFPIMYFKGSEEEDCLTLNVFRKQGTTKDDKKAVSSFSFLM